ncbi:MAG: biopolymer transporter ExbD [Candidatus Aerophobetes bacterium]|nr:biopolymer transporter ExbD [Candidatus Aerophobetes bacterium]
MRFRRLKSERGIIFNLTPLIDVIFLLLIFFMVSTSFATIRQGMKVDLPTTTTPQKKIEENIIISITKDNKIYIGRTSVSEKKLVAILKSKLKGKGGLVIVNADKNVRHGRVVEVMDLAKQGGAGKLGILTTPQRR